MVVELLWKCHAWNVFHWERKERFWCLPFFLFPHFKDWKNGAENNHAQTHTGAKSAPPDNSSTRCPVSPCGGLVSVSLAELRR